MSFNQEKYSKNNIKSIIAQYLFENQYSKFLILTINTLGAIIGFTFYLETIPLYGSDVPWFLIIFVPDCATVALLFNFFIIGPRNYSDNKYNSFWGIFYGFLALSLFRNGFLAIFYTFTINSQLWELVILTHIGLIIEAIAIFIYIDIDFKEIFYITFITTIHEILDFAGWFIFPKTLIQLNSIQNHHGYRGIEFFITITITMNILALLVLVKQRNSNKM